ncbi:D-alanyl-D-alanine carboxypeptidase [Reichenbachiella versicolor]|uniref:D-alanyl-D-alanine carboxypeptidase n=1 Tax=Reichenbachiella versicolor TaxID=1821036 RepID=UPI001C86D38E|nr:D-alanyl-D-alanine carboxypeptidase [Reichenbachiella versicolor]
MKNSLEKSDYFNSHFTGFSLYDPLLDQYLYEWNADKYFNLASNTKLLTYYAGLKLLGDSIPALKYRTQNDTLFFTGTGDPSFLNIVFKDQPTFEFLKDRKEDLVYVSPLFYDRSQAAGWTWEDYEYYYQPERSGFPIYGNEVSFVYDSTTKVFQVLPTFFKDYTEILSETNSSPQRIKNINSFNYKPDTSRSQHKNRVPFIVSDELIVELLSDTLNKELSWLDTRYMDFPNTFYSMPSKRLYAYMLKASDNLIAEHLHYLICTQMGLAMRSSTIREYVKRNFFQDVKNQPIWKDGSGLSRYNLATPRFMIELLVKIGREVDMDELKSMLAIGGVDGTIRHWYKANEGESPFVFAKTGTLSNNHNLTGVITTRSGRNLFFSFMNNNYSGRSSPVKSQMEKVLRMIHEEY